MILQYIRNSVVIDPHNLVAKACAQKRHLENFSSVFHFKQMFVGISKVLF